jgi:hypothetical protein
MSIKMCFASSTVVLRRTEGRSAVSGEMHDIGGVAMRYIWFFHELRSDTLALAGLTLGHGQAC